MKTVLAISVLLIISAATAASVACASARNNDLPPLETVPYVDLFRYVGDWYEIASFPQSFQRGCTGSMARYSLRSDGDIDVLNECRLDALDGNLKQARGKAWVTDSRTNAKLRVRFFWPFSGKYWIIDLGAQYEYAVVGHPSRDYLWILSRSPVIDENTYALILDRLNKQHYDISRLVKTLQPDKTS